MDFFKTQLDRIKQQLAGLNATQRMLVAALVALMGITLYYWAHNAASPDMVPVVNSTLTDTQAQALVATLNHANITCSISNGQVLVPADRQLDAIAMVSHDQLLPSDTKSTFDEIFKSVNAFDGDTSRDMHYVQYLQATLAGEFQRWPEIATATVLINDHQEWRVEDSIQPSASVMLGSKEHQLSGAAFHKLVSAASTLVASAVSGLNPSRVTVAIDERAGRGVDPSADSGGGGDDLLDREQAEEDRLKRVLEDQFFDIPNLAVAVSCDVENRSVTEHKLGYDPSASLTKPTDEKEHTEESRNSASSGGEPGVGANTSATIPTGNSGGGDTDTTSSDTETRSQTFAGSTEKSVLTPAGKVTARSASLRIPRSYFASLCRNPDGSEPTEATVQARAELEKVKIRDQVQKAISVTADAVSVEMYNDPVPTLANAATASIASPALATVTGHFKEIGVLALAVISLFMMSSMVRKSAPAPMVIPAAASSEKSGPSLLGGEEILAGEAAFGQAALDGMELDEETVRTQQMLEQVSTMVKENPDNAAALVKRWLNRG